MTTVVATPGQGSDRVQEVSYTDTRVIGNGSFGVVFQAKLIETNELVAIKKVLQDRRFKVRNTEIQQKNLLCVNEIVLTFDIIKLESDICETMIDSFVEYDIFVVEA